MRVGLAAGAALFGYSAVLAATAGTAEDGDWEMAVQRHVDSCAAPDR
jgi:hypothetical protein